METIAKIGRAAYLPWEPLTLIPIGDIQYDGPDGAADLPRLRKLIEWGVERGAYFIGMGDFVDFLSPSNRESMKSAGLYDTASAVVDRAATRLEDELIELLKPTKARWVGLLQGHHYFDHLDGATSDTRIAYQLGAVYLGDCAIVRITFREKGGGSAMIKLWAHHGHGGGGLLPASGLNKLYHQKVRYPNCRIFLMGHLPQLGHMVSDGLDVTDRGEPELVHSDTHFVLTGGFARSYRQGSRFAGRAQGSYAEKRMLPPAVLGAPIITLTPERHHGRGNRSIRSIDVKVSS